MAKLAFQLILLWASLLPSISATLLPECGVSCADITCGTADASCFCSPLNSSFNAFEQCIGQSCPPLDFQAAHLWVSNVCGRVELSLQTRQSCDVDIVTRMRRVVILDACLRTAYAAGATATKETNVVTLDGVCLVVLHAAAQGQATIVTSATTAATARAGYCDSGETCCNGNRTARATGGNPNPSVTEPISTESSRSLSSSSSVSFTSLTLVLTTVVIVTPTGPVTQPSLVNTPAYSGSGNILASDCTTTEFTLIDAGSTVFYAPFVGCVSDRPECCPWTVALPVTTTITVTAGGTTTVVTSTSSQSGNSAMAYPSALDSAQQALNACPADYYTISGSCCPSNYQPYGAALGGATPCFSSLSNYAPPPTLTAGLAGQPSDTGQPTSAIINVVWAVPYAVAPDSGGGLSVGAKAGIGVGVPVAAIALGLLSFLAWRRSRKNKEQDSGAQTQQQQGGPGGPSQGGPQPQPQPAMAQLPQQQPYPAHGSGSSGFAPSAAAVASQTTGGSLLSSHNGGASELSTHNSPPTGAAYPQVGHSPPPPGAPGGGSPVYGAQNAQQGQGYAYGYGQQVPGAGAAQQPQPQPGQPGQPFYPSGGSYGYPSGQFDYSQQPPQAQQQGQHQSWYPPQTQMQQ
ncbi:hypothetical protein NKR23_g7987 [Pleurostoma richardsiae]|uniref:Extracellular membrane protein CFEM domain-containing protein n=1 Tax=Pleurostoma richardsiae TaxID=41990 RepID=A0AA38RKA5_9PEZI|nr:hypothetical protein NKR23_g7987 [Pleurostoma richardsiae]